MKSCRRGFMRCRSREGPWGSHHDEASALKWETSVGSTVEWDVGLCCFDVVVDMHREIRGRCIRSGVYMAGFRHRRVCDMQLLIDRVALAGFCGVMVSVEARMFVRRRRGGSSVDVTKPKVRGTCTTYSWRSSVSNTLLPSPHHLTICL